MDELQQPEPAESLNDFLWKVHSYTNDYIKLADTKAAFVAASTAGIIGAAMSTSMFDSILRSAPSSWSFLQWAAALGLLLLGVSFVMSIWVLWPRRWKSKHPGFIYWEAVIEHGDAKSFSAAIRSQTDSALTTSISNHVFVLAMIADRKYKLVGKAVETGVLGGVVTAVVIFAFKGLR
jgi:hypothetical protein